MVPQSLTPRTEFRIERSVAPARRFQWLDSVDITWLDRAIRKRAYGLFGRGSMKESIFSITAGTTTEERAKIRMGKALREGYRQKAFLMTKVDGRTKTAAAAQLNESLRRLQTDRIDLLQFHEVIRDSDPDRIFAEGGGMEAVTEAKRQAKVRFVGFTGPQESRHSSEDAGHSLKTWPSGLMRFRCL